VAHPTQERWLTLPVLMYHSVSAVPDGPMRQFAVPPALLREQLTALTGAGYRLVGLSEALDALDAGDRGPIVALTFDDGYADFVEHGVGVLAGAGARATLYPTVGHLGGSADWLGAAASALGPVMTWSQLAEVADAGVEIGNHGLHHHPLDVLPAEQLDREVRDSRDRLAEKLGRPVRSFAYPHGYNSARVRDTVARYGHTNACEVGRRLHRDGSDRFAVSRLHITPDHRGADLVELVRDGGPQLVPRLKRAAGPGWRLTRRVALRVFDRRLA
jgi:peptidoglycan/xylan/chitin deacetylase (PgdA/CDA1 family)